MNSAVDYLDVKQETKHAVDMEDEKYEHFELDDIDSKYDIDNDQGMLINQSINGLCHL